MEIRNTTLFFIGIIVLILGTSIVIFDYSQIQIFEKMDLESYYLLDEESKNIHQRLIIEFSVGIVILGLGMMILFGSMFADKMRWDYKKS